MKVITIGRSQENDYVINEPGVSKHNTQIIKTDDGRFFIVDMGSVNGTYVNGIRISGEHPLRPGDTVIVANISIDWQSFFAVENTAPVTSAPQKKSRGGWTLALILGIVAAALVAGSVFLMFYVKKQAEENVKTIDNLNKEKTEYQEKVRETEEDNSFKDADLEAYGDALYKLREENKKQREATDDTKKELEEAQANAEKLQADTKKTLEEAEKKYNDLVKESEAKQQILNDQINLNKKSVDDLLAHQDTLTKKLEEAQGALKQAQDNYDQRMNEMREFMDLMEKAEESGVSYETICDALGYDYDVTGENQPLTVLCEKFIEGDGLKINRVTKGQIQIKSNKQQ